jgi:hypothetical protein
LAPNLGPFKQALAVGLNPEFLLLGVKKSWEGPESCNNKMKFQQKENASSSMCGSYIENSQPKYNLVPQLLLTPKLG